MNGNFEALNCQSNGGPKHKDLKNIYMNCVKKQETKNSSDNQGYYDQDWRDNREQNHRGLNRNDGRRGTDDRSDGRDDMMGERDDRMGDDNDRPNRNTRIDDRMWNRDDRMSSGSDMGSRYDKNSRYDTSQGHSNRDDRYGSNNKWNTRKDDRMNSRDEYEQSNEYENQDSSRYPFRSSTQSSRRTKREKRREKNSGHRSQYNPNPQIPMDSQNYNRNDRKNNSASNTSRDLDDKACVLHCFLEKLEMTGENGVPDKYLVTHAITKDVKNEDLRDFLQESIEECFQILYNENTEEKCEFSKNLMMCLSEKGKANCDDWKDDIKF